jgi:hypothetical protein
VRFTTVFFGEPPSRLPEDTFTFLGYTFGRCYSRRSGGEYIGPRPATKKVQKLCRSLSEHTDRRTCLVEIPLKQGVSRMGYCAPCGNSRVALFGR